MPEGDTIHKVAAAIRPRLEGRELVRVDARDRRFERLAGERVTSVSALGKHLLIELENALVLRTHLGLYGSWHRYAPAEPWRRPAGQAALVLGTDEDVFVCFNARDVELLRAGSIRELNFVRRLGPDLLSPDVDLKPVVRRARELLDAHTPLADVLLDQRVACGIGNVYKSELLFIERCSPDQPLGATDDDTLRRLYATGRRLLARNLGGGPRTTRSEPNGGSRLWVYDRAGQPCLRCANPIRAERSGERQRTTFWCVACQPPAP